MNRTQSAYQAQLRAQATMLRQEADTWPRGRARDALLQQAQRLERSAIMEGWVSHGQRRPSKDVNNEAHHEPNLAPRTH